MRTLTIILAVALLVITTTSAYIRFTQAGLGCADWPGCYGAHAGTLTPSLDDTDPLFLPRALHRIAASAAGILVLVVAVMGWEQWGRRRARGKLPCHGQQQVAHRRVRCPKQVQCLGRLREAAKWYELDFAEHRVPSLHVIVSVQAKNRRFVPL